MSDESGIDNPATDTPDVSRREGVRRAAVLALAVGLGLPTDLFGKPPAFARLQVKFYKAPSDGGQLVGGVELTDAVTAFIGSPAGARTQVKWYDWASRELGTMGIPSMIQDKTRSLLQAPPPGE